MKFVNHIHTVITDILYPHVCVGCGADDTLLCAACERLLLQAEHDRCVSCGARCVYGNLCAVCLPGSGFDALHVLVTYEHPWIQELLHAYKYEGIHEAGRALAGLVRAAAERRWRITGIVHTVPVPLSDRRFRERGFNQTALFAQALAAAVGATVTDALERVVETEQQATLDRSARHENMRGAFAPRIGVQGSVLLVDDVYTTGSTMRACAGALRLAGASRVIGVAIAHRA